MKAEERAFRHRFFDWRIGNFEANRGGRFGAMLTGDGFLNSKPRLSAFVRFYRRYDRLNRGGCFQVMHHGAKRNWNVGVGAKLRPVVSLFSSYPAGEYRHPNIEVWRDFAPYVPRQIDRINGWSLKGRFVFT